MNAMKMEWNRLTAGARRAACAAGVAMAGLTGAVAALTGLWSANVQAQAPAWPVKPVRVIVGYAAGGGNDVIMRAVAQKLGDHLGQPVVIENKPGAGSIIAADFVAKGPADGYTLLMGPSGPMVFNPALYPKLPYSPQKDFAPIGLIGAFPLFVIVNGNGPIRSIKELVEAGKAQPDKANYASSAASFQFASELFNLRTGSKFVRIPYKGANESSAAVVAGDAMMTIADPGSSDALIKAGRVRLIATTGPQRAPAYPNVPTMQEAGVADFAITLWTGILAPVATPAPVQKRLQDALAQTLRDPGVRDRLQSMAVTPDGGTAETFAKTIETEMVLWAGVAKAANIRAD